jgi:hypothetical protein
MNGLESIVAIAHLELDLEQHYCARSSPRAIEGFSQQCSFIYLPPGL